MKVPQMNYDRRTIIKKINQELPIIVVYNYLLLNGRIHPKAITNEYILSGEIKLEPIDLDEVDLEKDKSVEAYCFFHSSKNMDSTNFVLPKKAEDSMHGKKRKYNYYKCFGCQHTKKSLGVIDFYMVMRFGIRPKLVSVFEEVKKEFWQSVEELSELMGITYKDDERIVTDEEKQKIRTQYILNRSATIYHTYLKNSTKASKQGDHFPKTALRYLFQDRGFSAIGNDFYRIIDEMQIGCAPKKFDSTFLYDQLKQEGFTDEELLRSKVVQYSKKSPDKIIDFHQNGIIIPYKRGKNVHNLYCRKFTKDKKFRHMKLGGVIEYPVNFDNAKQFSSIILVEGELDYVTFKALGFENVISVGGTNGFQEHHLDTFLFEYDTSDGERCRTIYLCLDEDGPGQEAVISIAERLLAAGFDVRAMRMETTHPKTEERYAGDPNEFLVKFGLDARPILEKILEEALSYAAFKLLRRCKQANLKTRTEQLGFLRREKRLFNQMEQDEKLFLALELAEYLNVKEEWLLSVWSVVPSKRTAKEQKIHEDVMSKGWILLFNNEAFAQACLQRLTNVLLYEDAHEFVEQAKKFSNLHTIVLHSELPDEYKDLIFYAFPDKKFRFFVGKDSTSLEEKKNQDFMNLFKPATNPYESHVS